jgi:3-methylcrotonyl-CoA carboxylase alpha subunit
VFEKILIANRGEIACRIIKTAQRLGIRTVAVFSDADASARHVALAGEALAIGAAPARDSYLRIERILDAARRSGATAIHPGYGFLSENAEFAEACAAHGITFVGAPAGAIRAMGDKAAAKTLVASNGIPVVPGYHGPDQSDARLLAEIVRIGYPALVKPVAGGGGKGMKIVTGREGAASALAAARREAAASFGDDRLLVERYLERPRHIEVQVFFDTHGGAVHLFERDCSLQRRHQKIIEEAPAPHVEAGLRARMGRTAIEAARAVAYVGAGTIEFIVDSDGAYYFMEMNTRLQVEHPVTEMVTGQDLVEWQLRVAAGEPLPCTQEQLALRGHAIEARIYAEDPDNDFLPSTGQVRHLVFPSGDEHVRIDTGVREGDAVTSHYDPMIAKLIATDRDRANAIRRLVTALGATEIAGVTTNIDFLVTVARHPAFHDGAIDTRFVDRQRAELLVPAGAVDDSLLQLAALAVLRQRANAAAGHAVATVDPHSPWNATDAWRVNADHADALRFTAANHVLDVAVTYLDEGYRLTTPSATVTAAAHLERGQLRAQLGGKQMHARCVLDADHVTVFWHGRRLRLHLHDPLAGAARAEERPGALTAPVPGTVVAVLVEAGAVVKRGDALLVLEAMKMEHTIRAPVDGTVAAIRFKAGEAVASEGAELLSITPATL